MKMSGSALTFSSLNRNYEHLNGELENDKIMKVSQLREDVNKQKIENNSWMTVFGVESCSRNYNSEICWCKKKGKEPFKRMKKLKGQMLKANENKLLKAKDWIENVVLLRKICLLVVRLLPAPLRFRELFNLKRAGTTLAAESRASNVITHDATTMKP